MSRSVLLIDEVDQLDMETEALLSNFWPTSR